MQALKIKYILLFAALTLAAKPFVGFALSNSVSSFTESSILVKVFTKRKQEYVKDSEYDINTVQKRLADPAHLLLVSLPLLLSLLYPLIFATAKRVNNNMQWSHQLSLMLTQPRYILGGTLLI